MLWKIFGPFFIVWFLVVCGPAAWVWYIVEDATGDPTLSLYAGAATLVVMHFLWIALFRRH